MKEENVICLSEKNQKDHNKLRERLLFVKEWLGESHNPNCSPSSQEWVSGEFLSGQRAMMEKEKKQIEELLNAR